jgi:Fe-S-cluster containining protein
MKNYTLSEMKDELFKEISLLEKKEERYLKCHHCPFKGKCCIDNDIDIREDEWERIQEFLNKHPSEREQVYQNFIHGRKCYFHTEECCLIHEIRPTNCIYTPYQLIQNRYDNTLYYSSMDEECNFETREIKMNHLLNSKESIVYLPDEKRYYLYLNPWFENFENQSEGTYKILGYDRLKEYFQDK